MPHTRPMTYWELLSVLWGAWELQLAAAQQLPAAYLDLLASPLSPTFSGRII